MTQSGRGTGGWQHAKGPGPGPTPKGKRCRMAAAANDLRAHVRIGMECHLTCTPTVGISYCMNTARLPRRLTSQLLTERQIMCAGLDRVVSHPVRPPTTSPSSTCGPARPTKPLDRVTHIHSLSAQAQTNW
nr:hypothetical protein CFP56_00445 [Quercus suber]